MRTELGDQQYKSRKFVVISTEVRPVPSFHKVPHSRYMGPSSQDLIAAFAWIGTSMHIEYCSRGARCSTDAHWAGTIGIRWKKHQGGRCGGHRRLIQQVADDNDRNLVRTRAARHADDRL